MRQLTETLTAKRMNNGWLVLESGISKALILDGSGYPTISARSRAPAILSAFRAYEKHEREIALFNSAKWRE